MSGAKYIPAAKGYFNDHVIPREQKVDMPPMRCRAGAPMKPKKKYYKQKMKRTQEGGKPYGLCQPLPRLAHFGLGVAMYFYVLLILMVCNIVTGLILLPRIAKFAANNELNNITDPRVYGTAACPELRSLELYGSQLANFRPRCDFPDKASTWSDFAICVVFAVAIVVAMVIQRHFEVDLDERVASAQDYSIIVDNPPEDADDPNEWMNFFSQFGMVRYVTVNKRNRKLLLLLLRKRLLMRKFAPKYYTDAETTELDIKAEQVASHKTLSWRVQLLYDKLGIISTDQEDDLLLLLHQLNVAIDSNCTKTHAVCSIFIIFEFEEEKQLALQALKNENSVMYRCMGRRNYQRRFRGETVLLVEESSEPDNFAWLNSSLDPIDRVWRKALSFVFSGSILLLCFLLVQAAYEVSPLVLLAVITVLDSTLPFLFTFVTNMEGNVDEDDRQESFMMKLFVSRILCAVVFPLIFTPWQSMLDVDQLASVRQVQLACCFITPLVRLVDITGTLNRQVLTRLFAKSEADALRYWSGTPFTLAVRYSEIAKIMFISLFYSFLDPAAIFLAALACLNSFFIDRYLLLRKTAAPPLLDNSMGPTVLKLLALSLLTKIIMSLYFAYSWTFDDIYFDQFGNYQQIDKSPPHVFWNMKKEPWHTDLQWKVIESYTDYAIVAIAYCFVICFYQWFGKLFLFCLGRGTSKITCSNQQPYSAIPSIVCYCPVVTYGPESFLAAGVSGMRRVHRPDTIDLNDMRDREFNFAYYLPSHYAARCLAQVQWYSYPQDPPIEEGAMSMTTSHKALDWQASRLSKLELLTPEHSKRIDTPLKHTHSSFSSPYRPVLSVQVQPTRFGRIIGGQPAPLAPISPKETGTDITKKLRKELGTQRSGRFSGSAAIEPSGYGLVDFDGFLSLLRERCPKTCQAGVNGSSSVSPAKQGNLENKLKSVFMYELLHQNRSRDRASDLVDFDEFLDRMMAVDGPLSGRTSDHRR